MKVTCEFSGRLGNVLLEVVNTFMLADSLGVGKDNVIFRKSYRAANGIMEWRKLHPEQNNKIDGYIMQNRDILRPIWSKFLDEDEWQKVTKDEQCQYMTVGAQKKGIQQLPVGLLSQWFYDADVFTKYRSMFPQYWSKPSIAIHFRRGDFSIWGNGEHMQSAGQAQREINTHAGKQVAVFSDDREWCLENLVAPPDGSLVVHPTNEPACVDMIVMSCFKTVIHNPHSSYSLFAKCLSKDLQETGAMTW